MKRFMISFLILVLIVITIGCNDKITKTRNEGDNVTKYYIIENDKKTYFKDDSFLGSKFNFKSTLDRTVKSFNEIKNGKRDLNSISEIESEELKNDKGYKIFKNIIPGESELKTVSANIKEYNITGLIYNKDKNQIKVYINIKTYEKNEKHIEHKLTVFNNQTYVYMVKDNNLLLLKYDLSQYLH